MGEAAALIAAFTWSATSVGMARLSATVTPVAMSALRLAIASLLIPIVLVIAGEQGEIADASTSAIAAMVGSGILAYAIGDTVYIAALGALGVQRAFTLSMALYISLTVAGGIVLLDEEFGWLQGVGALLLGAGIVQITRERVEAHAADAARPRRGPLYGYVLLAIVGVTWTAATLWLAEGRGELGSIAASAIRTPAGAVGMLAFGIAIAPRDLVTPLTDRKTVLGIVAVALTGTLFGSLLYVYAVGEAGAARTSILNAASPLLAMPLAIVFLKERFRPSIAFGTLLCVAGIVLVVL